MKDQFNNGDIESRVRKALEETPAGAPGDSSGARSNLLEVFGPQSTVFRGTIHRTDETTESETEEEYLEIFTEPRVSESLVFIDSSRMVEIREEDGGHSMVSATRRYVFAEAHPGTWTFQSRILSHTHRQYAGLTTSFGEVHWLDRGIRLNARSALPEAEGIEYANLQLFGDGRVLYLNTAEGRTIRHQEAENISPITDLSTDRMFGVEVEVEEVTSSLVGDDMLCTYEF